MNEAELSEGPIVDNTLLLRYVEPRTQLSSSTFESAEALLRTPSRERSRA